MRTTSTRAGSLDHVVIAHGGGGELMSRLIQQHILPHLANEYLSPLTDSAVLPWPADELVFTTDSYVVTPIEFPGGNIGRLAVAGTVNDLAVMGAEPVALSLGLILEEGLPLEALDRVMASIEHTGREAGVKVVTGDTKVIERRRSAGDTTAIADGMFINTAGVGRRRPGANLALTRACAGDAVLVNGTLADHGLTVMSVRNGIEFESDLRTDAAPLNGLIAALLDSGADVKFLRDATRGGVAGVLADISEATGLSIEITEASLPITPTARHAAEMLGLDPLTVANEGKVVCLVSATDTDRALAALRANPLGRQAVCIGHLTDNRPPLVELLTLATGRRVIQRPYGEELPRIC
ncbi:MAG: hydrogenase expression/formation protein HypE [Planctomycetota bacterium]